MQFFLIRKAPEQKLKMKLFLSMYNICFGIETETLMFLLVLTVKKKRDTVRVRLAWLSCVNFLSHKLLACGRQGELMASSQHFLDLFPICLFWYKNSHCTHILPSTTKKNPNIFLPTSFLLVIFDYLTTALFNISVSTFVAFTMCQNRSGDEMLCDHLKCDKSSWKLLQQHTKNICFKWCPIKAFEYHPIVTSLLLLFV